MNKTISRQLLVFAALVFTGLFLFLFKIDKNELISTNPEAGMENLKTARVLNFGQSFKVKGGLKRFNTISTAVYNPGNKPAVCRFFLRTKKNGQVIFQGKLRLPKNTARDNTETITFPPINPAGREDFYFELKSRKAFEVLVFPDSPPSDRDSLLFRVSDQQRLSLISYASQITNRKTRSICFFLIILAVAGLISAGFMLGFGSNRRTLILVIVFLAVFIFSIICVSFFIGNNTPSRLLGAQDDAYITYEYARNIAAGKGFTFNPDEKILGTTTPLYTLVLALFGAAAGNIHIFSLLICLASILGSGIFIYLILADHFSSLTALSGGIIFLFFPMFYRALGMETNFLIFLIIAGLYYFSRDKTNLGFFILGLAVLTRMETLIIPPVLVLVLLYKKKFRQLLTGMGIFILTIMPWFIFSHYYFGNLFPNTFYAKTAALQSQSNALPRINHLITRILKLNFLKSLYLTSFSSYLPDYIQSYFIWLGMFTTALLASLKSLFRISFFRLYILWVGLYILAMAVLNVSPFVWYYILPLSVIPIVLPVGLSQLKGRIGRLISVLAVMGLVLFAGKNTYDIFYSHWYTRHISNLERYTTFEYIAEYIQENIPVESSIAMEEIGIAAYGIDSKIWDVHYLIHDTSHFPAGYSAPGPNRIPRLLKHMQPDYILFHSGRLAQSTYYSQGYSPIKVFPVNSFALKPAFFYVLMKSKE